jgi:hypothetical protein
MSDGERENYALAMKGCGILTHEVEESGGGVLVQPEMGSRRFG